MATHRTAGTAPVGHQAWHFLAAAETANGRATRSVARPFRHCAALQLSAVVGSIILATGVTAVAGNPLRLACSCTSASLSAM